MKDSYIVAFGSVKDRDVVQAALTSRVSAAAAAAATGGGGGAAPVAFTASVNNKFSNAFPGFALKASAKALEFLAGRKEVLAILPDQVYTLDDTRSLRGEVPMDVKAEEETTEERQRRRLVATDLWGLDRIDQANLPT